MSCSDSIIGEHEAGRQLSVRVAPDARKKGEGCFFKLKSSPTAAYSWESPVGKALEMRNITS